VEENIGCLYVPVQDLSVVDVLDSGADLQEPGPNYVLWEKLLGLLHHLDLIGQVLGVAKLLHDAQIVGRDEVVPELDNVGVVEHAEQLCLLDEVGNFFALHLGKVDLFNHQVLLVGSAYMRAHVYEPVRALANLFALLVFLGNRPKPLYRRHFHSTGVCAVAEEGSWWVSPSRLSTSTRFKRFDHSIVFRRANSK
jgi:hypothetical protein